MQYLISAAAAVGLLLFVRFLLLARSQAGLRSACWESAGCLLLASVVLGPAFVLVTNAAPPTDNPDPDRPKSHSLQVAAAATSGKALTSDATPDGKSSPGSVDAQPDKANAPGGDVAPVAAKNPVPAKTVAGDVADAAADAAENVRREGISRRQLLEELHAETVTKFVEAPGFGFERRIIIRQEEFETPEKSRLYLPRPVFVAQRGAILASRRPLKINVEIPLPDRSCWMNPRVAGQQQNFAQLRTLLETPPGSNINNGGRSTESAETKDEVNKQPVELVDAEPEWDEWEVSDWELVSILKNDPPVVYSSHRPLRMMHRPHAKETRPLDDIEKDALAKLREGEDLVVKNGVNAIRFVGAVQAGEKCIQCHNDKQKGDLLGAFSYELHRVRRIAIAAQIGK